MRPARSSTIVRSETSNNSRFIEEIQLVIWAAYPNLPLANIRSLESFARESVSRSVMTLVILAIAAAVAVFLGSVGLYAVISYAVSTRIREIGVRVALGASRKDITGMVLGQG